MKLLNALIVDDEFQARENLKDMLEAYCPDVVVADECKDVTTALVKIANFRFDILFLDINLGAETGFDLLGKLEGEKNFHIVFVTAYDQYALKAFKAEAIDYLLKPLSRTDLIQCIEKIKRRALVHVPSLNPDLLSVIKALQKAEVKKIIVPGRKDGSDIIAATRIIYLQADGSYTKIWLDQGRELYSSKNLKHYEMVLEETSLFIRVHKSFLVNREHITRIIKTQPARIILSNDAIIPISEQMKEMIYNIF